MDYLCIMVIYIYIYIQYIYKQDLSNVNGICIFFFGGEYQGIYYGTCRVSISMQGGYNQLSHGVIKTRLPRKSPN